MNHSWSTPIDKLMLWRGNNWVKYEPKPNKLILQIHFDQLLLISENKVLESFNTNSKIKGIYKDDILILMITNETEIRKVKLQVMSNTIQCFKWLGKLFPVVAHDKSSKKRFSSKYRNMNEVVKYALTQKDAISMPEVYTDFVKLCLLDPDFPKVVAETEKILHSKFKKYEVLK